jgi:NADH-quinone oxidoreductase subunit E
MLSPQLRAQAQQLVDRYPVGRSALLPLLHLVQHQDGYVSDDGIAECAELLGLTKAEVQAVSTFYTMYKRAPMGEHLVSVCTNFSCKVRGAAEVYDRLHRKLGVGHNETTADGKFTLEHAECLGNCEGAPVVTIDYFNYECVTPEQAEELIDRIAAGEIAPPTRGPIPPGVRAVEHTLAGLRSGATTAEHTGEALRYDSAAPPSTEGQALEREAEQQARETGNDPDAVEEQARGHAQESPTSDGQSIGTPEDRVEMNPEAQPHEGEETDRG